MSSNSRNKEMDAVVQRNIIRNKSDKRYCPAIVYKINEIKYHVKFGDGTTGLYNKKQLYINDPNDIDERESYWKHMKIIFESDNKVLANVQYDTTAPNYQYGIIIFYDVGSNACTIDFDNYGQLPNIPTKYIMTPMDNRFIAGIRNIDELLEEEIAKEKYDAEIDSDEEFENENMNNLYEPDKYCDPLPNINNDYSDDDLENIEKLAKKRYEIKQKELNSWFTKARAGLYYLFMILGIGCILYMGKLLFVNKMNDAFFDIKLPFPCIEFKNIVKIVWILFMFPIVAPLYVIRYLFTELLRVFDFITEKFDIAGYLSGSKIQFDNMGVSHRLAVIIYICVIVVLSVSTVSGIIIDIKDNVYPNKIKEANKKAKKNNDTILKNIDRINKANHKKDKKNSVVINKNIDKIKEANKKKAEKNINTIKNYGENMNK
jgi:hypothetical protein